MILLDAKIPSSPISPTFSGILSCVRLDQNDRVCPGSIGGCRSAPENRVLGADLPTGRTTHDVEFGRVPVPGSLPDAHLALINPRHARTTSERFAANPRGGDERQIIASNNSGGGLICPNGATLEYTSSSIR